MPEEQNFIDPAFPGGMCCQFEGTVGNLLEDMARDGEHEVHTGGGQNILTDAASYGSVSTGSCNREEHFPFERN